MKKSSNIDMTVYDLSVLMMKQFERFENKFTESDNKSESFREETAENFRLVNLRITNVAKEVNKNSKKLDVVNDKASNSFYLGQEVKRLEVRVKKLEDK